MLLTNLGLLPIKCDDLTDHNCDFFQNGSGSGGSGSGGSGSQETNLLPFILIGALVLFAMK